MSNQFDEVNAVADAIGKAIAKHYKGNVNIYPTLGALSTIAAVCLRAVCARPRKLRRLP